MSLKCFPVKLLYTDGFSRVCKIGVNNIFRIDEVSVNSVQRAVVLVVVAGVCYGGILGASSSKHVQHKPQDNSQVADLVSYMEGGNQSRTACYARGMAGMQGLRGVLTYHAALEMRKHAATKPSGSQAHKDAVVQGVVLGLKTLIHIESALRGLHRGAEAPGRKTEVAHAVLMGLLVFSELMIFVAGAGAMLDLTPSVLAAYDAYTAASKKPTGTEEPKKNIAAHK